MAKAWNTYDIWHVSVRCKPHKTNKRERQWCFRSWVVVLKKKTATCAKLCGTSKEEVDRCVKNTTGASPRLTVMPFSGVSHKNCQSNPVSPELGSIHSVYALWRSHQLMVSRSPVLEYEIHSEARRRGRGRRRGRRRRRITPNIQWVRALERQHEASHQVVQLRRECRNTCVQKFSIQKP